MEMKAEPALPLLISVPHGGVIIPPEVQAFCRLDMGAILRDGDTWSRQLYDLESQVLGHVHFPLARAVLDVNRAPGDQPPRNPDGVVKTMTVDGELVWSNPEGLSKAFVELLLSKYYEPYHAQLTRAAMNRQVVLALDCHTMLERAPGTSANPGERRPLICLSNRGDARGEQQGGEPLTAPPLLMRSLQKSLQNWFADLAWDESLEVVTINSPFKGGFVVEKHGLESGLPWVQVEINRALYLPNPFPYSPVPEGETLQRITQIRQRFLGALAAVIGDRSIQ